MKRPDRIRRTLLAAAATAGAVGLGLGSLYWNRPRSDARRAEPAFAPDPDFPNPLRVPGASGMYGVLDATGASLTLTAKPVRHALLPGKPARLLAYAVEHEGRTLLNPVVRTRTGTSLRIKLWNALEEPSIIHWHGLRVDSNNDGHPRYAVDGGSTYDYQFTVANRAGAYWYHPHPHHLTGKQVHQGLAGLLIVEDDEELALQKALDLRFGETDLPLVLQDRRLDENGQPVYSPTAEEMLHGYLGTDMLVNLTSRPHLAAATRLYRFRILNGSNARVYRLGFRHGERLTDFHVIGTDGGLLDRPRTVRESFLSPGERLDVLLDLRAAQPGDTLALTSLPFDPMHQEMGGAAPAPMDHAHHGGHEMAGMPDGNVPDGAAFDLMRMQIRHRVAYDRAIPQALSKLGPVPETTFSPRLVVLDQARGKWRINGTTYRDDATPIVMKRGTSEIWDLRNVAPSMPHPMHVHGFPFRVISRTGSPEQQQRLAIEPGRLAAADLGWKDTVLVWPGETVRIAIDFTHPFRGDQVYMVHCHNLEHEDGGMMVNMKVKS